MTAQPWEDKVAQAAEVWRQHGLHRVHIVAHAPDCRARDIETAVSGASLPTAIDPSRLDLSVLDLGHEIRSLVARLTKSGRRRFIEHLWDLLVEHHQDPHAERLVRHVEALGLTAPD